MIELFGIPASGKSTYASNYLKDCEDILRKFIYSESRIKRNLNKIFWSFVLIISNHSDYMYCKQVLKTIKFKNIKMKLKMRIYLYSYVELILKYRRDNKTESFLDEGMLNIIWALSYNSNLREDEIIRIYNKFERYILENIVIFDIEKDIVKQRLLERKNNGGSELEHDIKENDKVLDKAINIFRVICLEVNKNDKFKIKSTDGVE